MAELLGAIASWQTLLLVLAVFGFAPGFTLRSIVRIYPKDDPRRTELLAELYSLKRLERPLFVAEQLETVLFEGLPKRIGSTRRAVDKKQRRKETEGQASWHGLTGHEMHTVCIKEARSGNREAMDALVGDLTSLVWHVARSYNLDRNAAEEVTQDVWLECFGRLSGRSEPSATEFTAWLVTDTRRRAQRRQL